MTHLSRWSFHDIPADCWDIISEFIDVSTLIVIWSIRESLQPRWSQVFLGAIARRTDLLLSAVAKGSADLVTFILKQKQIDLLKLIPTARWNLCSIQELLLLKACRHNQGVIVKILLTDPRVNPQSRNNYAIRYASCNGYLDIVNLLLADSRVDPSANDNFALRMACWNGHAKVLSALLADSRVDPSANDNEAIQKASRFGHLEVVKLLLLDSRVDPSANDNYAIWFASWHDHTDVVKVLFADYRVNPLGRNTLRLRGRTLLQLEDPRIHDI